METIEYVRPWVYEKQKAAIFGPSRYAIIEASTKTGKTVGCIIWLAEQAMQGKEGQNFWWVAPVYSQAKIAFRRLKRYLPRELYTSNEGELTITLPNGAVIWFKGADKPDSLYGEDVYAAVVDEASRVKADAWYAVRSTLTATNGPVRIIGNVKGRKNWFYDLSRRAQNGEPGYHYTKLTAYDAADAGILAYAEIEDAKRTLPEHIFRELYLAEPSDDGGNPFGLQHIERIATLAGPTGNEVVAWGWDLAKSVDWTVGVGIDQYGQLARFERFQKPWPETIEAIWQATGNVPALVDSTGVGDPILEQLQRKGGHYEGYTFSGPSKQKLMEGLASAIQGGRIAIDRGPLYAELCEFEYAYTRTGVRYSAPEGQHDDCVMALALAVHHHTHTAADDAEYLALMDRLYA